VPPPQWGVGAEHQKMFETDVCVNAIVGHISMLPTCEHLKFKV